MTVSRRALATWAVAAACVGGCGSDETASARPALYVGFTPSLELVRVQVAPHGSTVRVSGTPFWWGCGKRPGATFEPLRPVSAPVAADGSFEAALDEWGLVRLRGRVVPGERVTGTLEHAPPPGGRCGGRSDSWTAQRVDQRPTHGGWYRGRTKAGSRARMHFDPRRGSLSGLDFGTFRVHCGAGSISLPTELSFPGTVPVYADGSFAAPVGSNEHGGMLIGVICPTDRAVGTVAYSDRGCIQNDPPLRFDLRVRR